MYVLMTTHYGIEVYLRVEYNYEVDWNQHEP